MSAIQIEFAYPSCVNCGHTFGVAKALWDHQSSNVTCPACGKAARFNQGQSNADFWRREHNRLEEENTLLTKQLRGYRNYIAGLRQQKAVAK